MSFNEDAGLDTSQVSDVRGGGGIPGGGIAIGGGAGPDQRDNTAISQQCRSGADANAREDCRVVATVNSVQAYWKDEFARRGGSYEPARTILFSDAVRTGCGTATSAVGPFYCPTDRRVYIDVDFFAELRNRFGAQGGPFAQEYVVAHEYGHHVQNLLGVMDRVGNDRQGAQGGSVRLELQADCLAGVWAHHAAQTTDRAGRPLLRPLTEANIADALNAAEVIGDDRIQEQTQGQVNPETWTHGSSAQRQRWFSTGYHRGDLNSCNTFRGDI